MHGQNQRGCVDEPPNCKQQHRRHFLTSFSHLSLLIYIYISPCRFHTVLLLLFFLLSTRSSTRDPRLFFHFFSLSLHRDNRQRIPGPEEERLIDVSIEPTRPAESKKKKKKKQRKERVERGGYFALSAEYNDDGTTRAEKKRGGDRTFSLRSERSPKPGLRFSV